MIRLAVLIPTVDVSHDVFQVIGSWLIQVQISFVEERLEPWVI